MTDIDIERLRKTAMEVVARGTHWDVCHYSHGWCAMVTLIKRLENCQAYSMHERSLGYEEGYESCRKEMQERLDEAEAKLALLKAAMQQILDKRKMDTTYIEKVLACNRGKQSR